MQKDTYWILKSDEDLLKEANKRIENYFSYLQSSGLYHVLSTSLAMYYGANQGSNGYFDSIRKIKGTTDRNTLYRNCKVNHYKSLSNNIIRLASTEKTAFSPQATSSDYEAVAQTSLASSILDTYEREKKVDEHFNKALKNAVVALEGWVHVKWEKNLGEKYISDNSGKWLFEGDVSLSTHLLPDVIRNYDLKDHTSNHWYIVREEVSKWDLAADFPDYREEILSTKRDIQDKYPQLRPSNHNQSESSDLITVYTLYHKKTPAVPNGKLIRFTPKKVIQNLDLPYKEIPLFRVSADHIEGTPFGWSPAMDLISPQILADISNSTIATLLGRKATQNVWVSSQDDFSVEERSGTKVFKSEQPAQPLDLSPIPADMVAAAQGITQQMATIANISQPTRGELPSAGMSGSALALLSANSISFHSALEWSFNRVKGSVATAILDHLREFSKTERVFNLISETNKPFQHTFKSEDIGEVRKVIVKTVNPLSKTTAGRLQVAEQLIQMGFVTSPEKYISLLRDGNLDAFIEGEHTEQIAVKAENEALRKGEQLTAIITDNHSLHIREHKAILADPYSRQDPELVQRTLAHIQEHIELAKSITPEMAQLLQIQSIMPAPAPIPPVASQQQNPAIDGAEQPSQPNLPIEPLSGEQFDPNQH